MGNGESNQFQVIPDKIYFTISEASELCGVSSSKLRYWEERFSNVLKVRRRNNRRYYTRENITAVREIKVLIDDRGFTASGVVNYFKEKGQSAQHANSLLTTLELQQIVGDMKSLRTKLREPSLGG